MTNYDIDLMLATEREPEIITTLAKSYVDHSVLGVPFVDEALVGVLPTDLILVGALSGKGKTQLCIDIAKHNAIKGKKVLFLALEAEKNEIELRLMYQILVGMYFQDMDRDRSVYVDYRRWRMGILDLVMAKYYFKARQMFHERYRTLRTVYRTKEFTLIHLYDVLSKAEQEGIDLVILDHLHYIDMEVNANEQNIAMSRLIKRIRDLNLFYNVPFICAAHTRKDVKGLVPELEEFMGSSDIGKNGTVCIMMAPRPDGYDSKNATSQTLFTLPKTRTGGMGNLCGIATYSIPLQAYAAQYKLGRIVNGGTKVIELGEEEWPEWARNSPLIKPGVGKD